MWNWAQVPWKPVWMARPKGVGLRVMEERTSRFCKGWDVEWFIRSSSKQEEERLFRVKNKEEKYDETFLCRT